MCAGIQVPNITRIPGSLHINVGAPSPIVSHAHNRCSILQLCNSANSIPILMGCCSSVLQHCYAIASSVASIAVRGHSLHHCAMGSLSIALYLSLTGPILTGRTLHQARQRWLTTGRTFYDCTTKVAQRSRITLLPSLEQKLAVRKQKSKDRQGMYTHRTMAQISLSRTFCSVQGLKPSMSDVYDFDIRP